MKKNLVLIFLIFILVSPTAQAGFIRHKAKPQQSDYKLQYVNLDWWQRYNDPVLIEHLKKFYQNNHDLKIISLRVNESEKLVKISFSQELPKVYAETQMYRTMASSDIKRGNSILPNYSQNNFYFPLSMSYELDIWGANRLKTKSVEKRLAMAKQDEKAGYISLTSGFAADYFNLIKIDKLIQIQQELLGAQKQIVSMTEQKHNRGLLPITALIETNKILTLIEEDLNSLEEKQNILLNQMSVYLSDREIKDLPRTKYEDLTLLENLPESLNSDVIQSRPDMLKAEDNLQRVGYDVKVAKKDFLPKIVIFGQVGLNGYNSLASLTGSNSKFANAGIYPLIDIFNGGRKMAILKLRKDEYNEAIQQYEKTILTSFQEVNDSLASFKAAKENYNSSTERQKLENEQFEIARQKNIIGTTSNLDTLFSKQKLLLAQKSEVSSKINCLITSINLYKAVGGKDLYSLEDKENL